MDRMESVKVSYRGAFRGGVVLAGGKSSRMGQDKALLPSHGKSLLEQVIETVRPLVSDLVVVTDVAERYVLSEVRSVADLFPNTGPVGGILTGLMALGEGSHLVVACDMPCLQSSVLESLWERATPEWDAVIPERQGQLEPLCAVYRTTAIPKLQAFLETGQRAAHKAVATLNACIVREAELRALDPALACFINLNTPQDLERFLISSTQRKKLP